MLDAESCFSKKSLRLSDMDLGMCGKSSLKKLRTEGGWGSMSPASLEPLEQALTVLEEDLKSKKEEKKDMHRASVAAPNV